MTIHDVRIYWVSSLFKRQNNRETEKNENVGYLSAFRCGVLLSSVWKNVGVTMTGCEIGVM